jgi:hypothetical protein
VIVSLDVLVAEDPWADVVVGNWKQGSVAPWVAGASEVGLLRLDGTFPRKQINPTLIKMVIMTKNVVPFNSKYAEN